MHRVRLSTVMISVTLLCVGLGCVLGARFAPLLILFGVATVSSATAIVITDVVGATRIDGLAIGASVAVLYLFAVILSGGSLGKSISRWLSHLSSLDSF